MRELTPLCLLAKKYETDKGGRHLRYGGGDSDTCHEYTPIYWDLFGGQRGTVRRVLEIGINAGSSLRMWREFFPAAMICGIDCRPETLLQGEERIRCALADQNNPDALREAMHALSSMSPIVASLRRFDLIVDDGSHEPEHQITSLKTLLPYLSDHGLYVIEDLQVDCHPELIGNHVPDGFVWRAFKTEMGIGKAHCPCPECGGKGPEQLLVIRRQPPRHGRVLDLDKELPDAPTDPALVMSVPSKPQVTLVTAFFHLRDRAVDEDEQFRRFDKLAACGLPIVLFLDAEFMSRRPTQENVHVVPTSLMNLWPFTRVDNPTHLPSCRDPEKDTEDFLLLQCAKLHLLDRARIGRKDATHFAWIDFGITKIISDYSRFYRRLQELAPPPQCVLAPGCWPKATDPIDMDRVHWRFCGGFLLADRETIPDLAEDFRTAFRRQKKLTWEVNLWAEMERHGTHFDWYPADHDDSIVEINRARIVQDLQEAVNRGDLPSGVHFDFDKWGRSGPLPEPNPPKDPVPFARLSLPIEMASTAFGFGKAPKPMPPDTSPARICLCMIVKNESAIIERCLTAALPFIDTWAITDTGSTDGTRARVEAFFKEHDVGGMSFHAPFRNFAEARNNALKRARDVLRWDYALFLDADMVLEGSLDKRALTAPAYHVVQRNGQFHYSNVRLVRRDAKAVYYGVTHEYLSVEGVVPLDSITIDDRNDGGSRGDKGERDIRLLTQGLVDEPSNVRYMFYLAQTYRGMGRHDEAITWYKERIARGGWDEEVWASHYGMAQSYQALGRVAKEAGQEVIAVRYEAEFVRACINAYNYRPSRGEPLKLLAKFYREWGQNEAAALFAARLADIPYPGDLLFVEPAVYDYGAKEELAIAGFYSASYREAGYHACAALTVHPNDFQREQARNNFTHYTRSATDLFGAEIKPIEWGSDTGWAPMNPSVCVVGSRRLVLVRTVNYKVTDGQYPTNDGSGIIRTRNFILDMDTEWRPAHSMEIVDTTGASRGGPVEGFEDCRLWYGGPMELMGHSLTSGFYLSATARDFIGNPDNRCEMVIGALERSPNTKYWRIVSTRAIRNYEWDQPQKNWMPIVGRPRQFVYLCDPTVVLRVDSNGKAEQTLCHTPPMCLRELRGGSQVIPFGDGVQDGWLCITHEVVWRPERVYLHRFVRFDSDFHIVAVSDPFYFQHVGIEFCAGLAWANDTELVASFGVNDASAHLAFFDAGAVLHSLPVS